MVAAAAILEAGAAGAIIDNSGQVHGATDWLILTAYRKSYDRLTADAPMYDPFGQWRLKPYSAENK